MPATRSVIAFVLGLLGAAGYAPAALAQLRADDNGYNSPPADRQPARRPQTDPALRRLPPQNGASQPASAPPGQNATRLPARPAAPPPAAPFTLSPQEQAELDQILIAWERSSSAIKTFKCEFTRWEYNPSTLLKLPKNQPRTESTGEIRFAAPDKGLFKVTDVRVLVPGQKGAEWKKGVAADYEHWVCDGQAVFTLNHAERILKEIPLPQELRGNAIADGPLPFVFGAKAEKIKQRYWLRQITPPGAKDEIWLEARPRYQADAANYSKVEIILNSKDLMPLAIQQTEPIKLDNDGKPSDPIRFVYQFRDIAANGKFDNFFGAFIKPELPFGYKRELMSGPDARGPNPQSPEARAAQAPRGNKTR